MTQCAPGSTRGVGRSPPIVNRAAAKPSCCARTSSGAAKSAGLTGAGSVAGAGVGASPPDASSGSCRRPRRPFPPWSSSRRPSRRGEGAGAAPIASAASSGAEMLGGGTMSADGAGASASDRATASGLPSTVPASDASSAVRTARIGRQCERTGSELQASFPSLAIQITLCCPTAWCY